MQIKSFVTTMGLGMAAGAAAILLLPKESKAYRAADDAAQILKTEAGRIAGKMNKG